MARARKLKVFRTPIGFHDAYVAASSQKAALKAWGADANLFARGIAEEVTEDALTAEPLTKPGTVIKRLRGTEAEQLAAAESAPVKMPARKTTTATKLPRPTRDAVEDAERRLEKMAARHQSALDEIADREAKLRAKRRTLQDEQRAERLAAEQARDAAEADYQAALEAWRAA
jgi:hypothetical protein